MFFYGVEFDYSIDFEAQQSLGVALAFVGITVSTVNLVVANEVKTAPLTATLFLVGTMTLASEYGLLRSLDVGSTCLEMPVLFETVEGEEGGMKVGYGGNSNSSETVWWQTDDEKALQYSCPIILEGGAAYCKCCGNNDGVESVVRLVLYDPLGGKEVEETTERDIEECVCFSAQDLDCGDVEEYKWYANISTALGAALMVLTGMSLLLTVEGALEAYRLLAIQSRARKWREWKQKQINDLKKTLKKISDRKGGAAKAGRSREGCLAKVFNGKKKNTNKVGEGGGGGGTTTGGA